MASETWAARVAAELRSLTPSPEAVAETVSQIVDAVRREGDEALRRFTEEFDTADPPSLRVAADELDEAERALDPDVQAALEVALRNVGEVAAAGLGASAVVRDQSREVVLREEPVRRAAVYVPGGRAPYPSTVVMGVATARAAGVAEIVVCTPPPVDPAILAACRLAGAQEVYRMGGAQAIAALAHGTETVKPVDVIVGPGNVYVQEAKRQVSVAVGIDSFAGPSDLLVIVGEDVEDLRPLALDLLAQAEHGVGTVAAAVSTSSGVCRGLEEHTREAQTDAAIRVLHAPTLKDALELSEAFAPEHLQLVGTGPEALAPQVSRAGCLFLGPLTGTAFGDYVVGSNHILPTHGSARFASGLSVSHFRRRFAQVRITRADALARAGAAVARAEGFELHAQSMEARIRDNRSA